MQLRECFRASQHNFVVCIVVPRYTRVKCIVYSIFRLLCVFESPPIPHSDLFMCLETTVCCGCPDWQFLCGIFLRLGAYSSPLPSLIPTGLMCLETTVCCGCPDWQFLLLSFSYFSVHLFFFCIPSRSSSLSPVTPFPHRSICVAVRYL